jgi:hypothetical protein
MAPTSIADSHRNAQRAGLVADVTMVVGLSVILFSRPETKGFHRPILRQRLAYSPLGRNASLLPTLAVGDS